MLKEVTGTEAFDSRVEKMQTVLNECNQKKQQTDKILEAIRNRLEQLEQEIGEYRFIENIERERRALELALYQRKVQANRAEIEHIRGEKLKLLDQRQEMINQIDDEKLQNSGQGDKIIELRSHIKKLEVRYQNLLKLRQQLDLQHVNEEAALKQKSDQHTLYDYFSTSLEGQMKNIVQAVSSLEIEIKDLSQQSIQLQV